MDRYGIMQRVLEEAAQRRDGLRQRPNLQFLFFEVTTRCNLSCLHCGSSCSAHDGADMPLSYIQKTVRSVKEHCRDALPLLCVTGGEPLLYPELEAGMAYAARLGFAWGMTTNATLIRPDRARALYDTGLVSTTVSVDGLEESHDWFRHTPGAFRQMEKGVRALVDCAPPQARVDVLTVVNKRNLSELEEIYRYVSGLGVRSWRVVNMEPIGRARQNRALMLEPEDYRRLFDFIQEKHFTSKTVSVDYGCSHYLTHEYERMLRPYCFTCTAGLKTASVACNGDIIACLDIERRPELVQGHIQTDDFWKVWTEQYRFFRSDRTVSSGKCADCADRYLCAGDSAHTWDYDNHAPLVCMKEILASTAGTEEG